MKLSQKPAIDGALKFWKVLGRVWTYGLMFKVVQYWKDHRKLFQEMC